MASPQPYQTPEQISVEIDGRTYAGAYTVDRPMVHVSSEYGNGVIEDRNRNYEVWAKVRLRELVTDWLRKQRS